jgi:hypothetical protein
MVLILVGFTSQYETAENLNQEAIGVAFGTSTATNRI